MKNLTFLTFVLFWGCSGAGVVKINTIPNNADIKIIENSGEITPIGTSPHSLSVSELFTRSNYIQILVEKDNYESERVILTRPYLSTNFDLSFDLERSASPNKSGKDLEEVSIEIAQVYKKIQSKDFTSAESELKSLQKKYPRLSVVNDLLGNISYLNGNYEQAKDYYLKAASIQPNNYERSAILKKIEDRITR